MYGFNDCTVVEFGKGCFHVYGKDGVFGIVVEQGLREFVEFFSAARAADGELVVADGGGDGGVICLAIAAATMRRNTVPQAMGMMLPFGLRRGMTRAEARASRVVGGGL